MAEYIDREMLYDRAYWHGELPDVGNPDADGVEAVDVADIDTIPAADVAPVRHGRWEWLGPNRLVTDCMCGTCSACKVRSKYIVNTMLCPNCGAKMDGGNQNG